MSEVGGGKLDRMAPQELHDVLNDITTSPRRLESLVALLSRQLSQEREALLEARRKLCEYERGSEGRHSRSSSRGPTPVRSRSTTPVRRHQPMPDKDASTPVHPPQCASDTNSPPLTPTARGAPSPSSSAFMEGYAPSAVATTAYVPGNYAPDSPTYSGPGSPPNYNAERDLLPHPQRSPSPRYHVEGTDPPSPYDNRPNHYPPDPNNVARARPVRRPPVPTGVHHNNAPKRYPEGGSPPRRRGLPPLPPTTATTATPTTTTMTQPSCSEGNDSLSSLPTSLSHHPSLESLPPSSPSPAQRRPTPTTRQPTPHHPYPPTEQPTDPTHQQYHPYPPTDSRHQLTPDTTREPYRAYPPTAQPSDIRHQPYRAHPNEPSDAHWKPQYPDPAYPKYDSHTYNNQVPDPYAYTSPHETGPYYEAPRVQSYAPPATRTSPLQPFDSAEITRPTQVYSSPQRNTGPPMDNNTRSASCDTHPQQQWHQPNRHRTKPDTLHFPFTEYRGGVAPGPIAQLDERGNDGGYPMPQSPCYDLNPHNQQRRDEDMEDDRSTSPVLVKHQETLDNRGRRHDHSPPALTTEIGDIYEQHNGSSTSCSEDTVTELQKPKHDFTGSQASFQTQATPTDQSPTSGKRPSRRTSSPSYQANGRGGTTYNVQRSPSSSPPRRRRGDGSTAPPTSPPQPPIGHRLLRMMNPTAYAIPLEDSARGEARYCSPPTFQRLTPNRRRRRRSSTGKRRSSSVSSSSGCTPQTHNSNNMSGDTLNNNTPTHGRSNKGSRTRSRTRSPTTTQTRYVAPTNDTIEGEGEPTATGGQRSGNNDNRAHQMYDTGYDPPYFTVVADQYNNHQPNGNAPYMQQQATGYNANDYDYYPPPQRVNQGLEYTGRPVTQNTSQQPSPHPQPGRPRYQGQGQQQHSSQPHRQPSPQWYQGQDPTHRQHDPAHYPMVAPPIHQRQPSPNHTRYQGQSQSQQQQHNTWDTTPPTNSTTQYRVPVMADFEPEDPHTYPSQQVDTQQLYQPTDYTTLGQQQHSGAPTAYPPPQQRNQSPRSTSPQCTATTKRRSSSTSRVADLVTTETTIRTQRRREPKPSSTSPSPLREKPGSVDGSQPPAPLCRSNSSTSSGRGTLPTGAGGASQYSLNSFAGGDAHGESVYSNNSNSSNGRQGAPSRYSSPRDLFAQHLPFHLAQHGITLQQSQQSRHVHFTPKSGVASLNK